MQVAQIGVGHKAAVRLKLQLLAATAVMLFTTQQTQATYTAAVNGQVLSTLCVLKRLAEEGVEDDKRVFSCEEQLKELHALNMSLSQPEWPARFLKDGNTPIKWSDKERTAQKPPEEWEPNWDVWAEAAAHLKTNRDGDKSIDKNFANKVPANVKAIIQTRLSSLISAAMTTCSGEGSTKTRPTKEAIDKKLNQLIYATDQGRGVFGTDENSGGAGQVNNCANDGEINTKHLLAYAIMCVSMAASGQAGLKITNENDNAPTWEGTNNKG
uniref:Variant surface glycoprotein 1125.1585 n=1 Tax=Trypanosoma brucei TaxID=5691 RepID=A0A1J0R7A7_9TRYP|nr:variant surface glycoprotein 1125.1585 [Trypanosoma brucei]